MFRPVETLRVHLSANAPAELREGTRLWTFQQLSDSVVQSLEIVAAGKSFATLPSQKFQEFLLKERLIFKVQDFKEDSHHRTLHWLSYQTQNAEEVFAKMQSKPVGIIGCGGTGGLIAEHLVRAGIRSLVLVDGGLVDEPDLNRQLHFTKKDLGKPKVQALKERLLEIQPDLELHTRHELLSSTDQLTGMLKGFSLQLIVCAVDQPMYTIQAIVGETALQLETAVLFGAVGISDAVIGPLFTDPVELQKQNANFRNLAKDAAHFQQQIVRGSLCFTNTLAAAQMGLEAFKFLSGYGGELTIKNKALIVPYSI
ncbi:MAG: ThiF family adenylyltransferase [Bdellovibrionales bacterium]|nr:ThiF family adenylyltransferase [Bdellovibrionales bacterium]